MINPIRSRQCVRVTDEKANILQTTKTELATHSRGPGGDAGLRI
jgi:hypothetical protein